MAEEDMEMAATQAQPCATSSLSFFTHNNKTHLHNIIHLRRRFSSYAAGDRSGSSSRKRRRRKWDSNAETIRAKSFRFNTQNEEDDEEEDDDYGEELANSGILEEAIDSIWILKVFKSYGWALPVILLSLLFATGPKAFLMALALPLGQSAVTLAFEKLSGRSQRKQKPKARLRKKTRSRFRRTVRNVKMEEEVQEGHQSRKETSDYQSWVVSDDISVNEGNQGSTGFGGWDELDGLGPTRMPSTMASGSKRTTTEKRNLSMKESKSDELDGMGPMRMPSTMGSGSKRTTKEKGNLSMKESKSNEPLLLRLLIAVFPFLGSWTKLFW
ncbi:hypothetical protein PTKIN_Ptkin09bG0033900 [Pterospermum kingtungense]